MVKGSKMETDRRRFKEFAFRLYMKQAPDGKHLYSLRNIADKVNKKFKVRLQKAAIGKWATKTNEDGTTWKGCYFKALNRSSQKIASPQRLHAERQKDKKD